MVTQLIFGQWFAQIRNHLQIDTIRLTHDDSNCILQQHDLFIQLYLDFCQNRFMIILFIE